MNAKSFLICIVVAALACGFTARAEDKSDAVTLKSLEKELDAAKAQIAELQKSLKALQESVAKLRAPENAADAKPPTRERPSEEDRKRFTGLSEEARKKFIEAMRENREKLMEMSPDERLEFIRSIFNKIEAENKAAGKDPK